MNKYKRYNSDKELDPNGDWVRYDDVQDIPNIDQASRFYLNAWGNSIWDERGEWVDFGWIDFLKKKV